MPLTTVVQGMLANDSVTSLSISAENVREFDISLSAIRARHIKDYEIQTVHLSSNIINSRVIANSAVTTRHYAPSSIQNSHLSAFSVNTPNIATSAVTYPKLAFDVINIFNGSKVIHNNSTSLIFTGTNYVSAHGAIIINRCAVAGGATIQLDDSDNPVPSNFRCWILNVSLEPLVITGSVMRQLRYDARKLSPKRGPGGGVVNNTCVLTGAYIDGSAQQAFPFAQVFIGQDYTTTSEVFYIIPTV